MSNWFKLKDAVRSVTIPKRKFDDAVRAAVGDEELVQKLCASCSGQGRRLVNAAAMGKLVSKLEYTFSSTRDNGDNPTSVGQPLQWITTGEPLPEGVPWVVDAYVHTSLRQVRKPSSNL